MDRYPLRPTFPSRPPSLGLGRVRLGQASDSLVREVARSVVAQADPKVRSIISDERTRVAQAVKVGLPFLALSGAAFLGTQYAVSPKAKTARIAGFTASAGLLGLALWFTADRLTDIPLEESPAPSGGGGAGLLSQFAAPVATQMAHAVVQEAEPRIRDIVDDEKAKLAEAGKAALPWAGAAVATFAGTAFALPKDLGWVKAVGYSLSGALLLISIYQGLDKTEELAAAPAGQAA